MSYYYAVYVNPHRSSTSFWVIPDKATDLNDAKIWLEQQEKYGPRIVNTKLCRKYAITPIRMSAKYQLPHINNIQTNPFI